MTRPVSPAQIRDLIETALDDATLQVFANDSHVIVSETIPSSAGVSEGRLEIIEKYLAAHFTALRDPRLTSEHVGPATSSYEGQSGLYLAHTRYGQQVMVLDPTGSFAAMDQGASTGTVAELTVFTVATS